jgi:hypothetical protein
MKMNYFFYSFHLSKNSEWPAQPAKKRPGSPRAPPRKIMFFRECPFYTKYFGELLRKHF